VGPEQEAFGKVRRTPSGGSGDPGIPKSGPPKNRWMSKMSLLSKSGFSKKGPKKIFPISVFFSTGTKNVGF
jgi:hypothetical protein